MTAAPYGWQTHVLQHPVIFEGKVYTQITLRRLRDREWENRPRSRRGGSDGAIDETFALWSRLSGLPLRVFEEMRMSDLDALNTILGRIIRARPGCR
jgi:hypothetical protein